MDTSHSLFAVAGGLALAFFAGAHSQDVPDVLRARKLELVDAEGRPRAELGIDADGSAGLFVRDAEGRVRAAVIHDDSQSALYLFDAEDAIRVGAAQYAHGGGGFALHGEEAAGATVLYMQDFEGSLTFYDKEGGVRRRVAPE